MLRGSLLAALAVALVSGCGGTADSAGTAAADAPQAAGEAARSALSAKPFARGFRSPVHVAAPRNEKNRIYVVEQAGRILAVQNGRKRVFLDIRRLVRAGGEQGLLSVAFHPSYAKNRLLYVNYTDRRGDTRVVRYRSNGARALPGSAKLLLRVAQPYANHNGGQLAFGADGRLYVGMGDGGSGGDPQNYAQNLGSRLGKLLALNVNRAGAKWQVAGSGLRNPWRFSFDRATGDLYIGDVGQGAWEEISFLPKRNPGLENYGWSRFEGRARYSDRSLTRGRYVGPVAVYPNGGGNCSVTGGFVYRGAQLAAAKGRYFYGDYCSGTVWSLKVVRGKATSVRREPFTVPQLTSFGEDAAGELYLASHDGVVYRLSG